MTSTPRPVQPNRMAFRARRVTRLSNDLGAVATTPHHAYGSGGSSPDPISATMMNWLRSRTCEGHRRIHRAHVRGRPGTRICRGDFMVRCQTYANHRAEHYRDLAEECRRLAETTLSTPMRRRFWRMAEYYSTLAAAEGSGYTSLRRFATSLAPTTVRPLRTRAADPNSPDPESHKGDDAEPGSQPISLLSFLEAENVRLRQAVVELSLDASALREALKIVGDSDRVVAESVDRSRFRHADPNRGPRQ